MKRSTLRRAALPAAVVLSLSVASCSSTGASDDGGGSDSGSGGGTITGAGASSQQAAMEGWRVGFQDANPDATLNYDPVGSGGGRDQFLAGSTDFAGSDAYLDDEELATAEETCGGPAIELPNYIAPIAIAFNLEGVDSLNLSAEVIAGIFAEQITTWNDPAIAADNPDATLPDTAITPVHRSDESGTTENFVDYLSATAPDVWSFEVSGDWPSDLGGEAASGTSGVIQAIGAGDGTIGYADASQVGDLSTVAVGVGEEFVEYSPEAAAAVVEASERVEGRPEGDLAIDLARDTTEAGTYPIVLVSYHIACSSYEDAAKADLVKEFLTYVASEEGQQAAVEAAGIAPISETLRTDIQAAIDTIQGG